MCILYIDKYSIYYLFGLKYRVEGPYGIGANELDCDIIVSKFKLQSCNYFHFLTNTLLSPNYGLNSITIVLQGWF